MNAENGVIAKENLEKGNTDFIGTKPEPANALASPQEVSSDRKGSGSSKVSNKQQSTKPATEATTQRPSTTTVKQTEAQPSKQQSRVGSPSKSPIINRSASLTRSQPVSSPNSLKMPSSDQETTLKLPNIQQANSPVTNGTNRYQPASPNNRLKASQSVSTAGSLENYDKSQKRGLTSNSFDSSDSKRIYRWHLWWDKQHTEVRVPSYSLPSKKVPSKIASLENIGYKSNGGSVRILNEKLAWNKQSRIDSFAKGYKPGGGNRMILDEKPQWNSRSKIGSLANINHQPGGGNVQIMDQPFDKSGVRPKIDSGFIYEEVVVPIDYQVKSTPRPDFYEQQLSIFYEIN